MSIKERLAKLVSVKSIVTIVLTIAFVVALFMDMVTQEFMMIYTVVMSFYFGTQTKKQEQNNV